MAHVKQWTAAAASLAVVATLGLWFSAPRGAQGDAPAPASEAATQPTILAKSPAAAGRYLVQIAGCNDCHTAGFAMKDGHVPESEWLTGSPIGWRGPWGTTYASNLRLYAASFTPKTWVHTLRTRKDRLPPMPWSSLDAMSDQDLEAIYAYLTLPGPKGEKMPANLAPGVEPTTPYTDMMPKMPGGAPLPVDAH